MDRKVVRVCDLDYVEEGDDVIVRLAGRDEYEDRSIHHITGTRPCCWTRRDETIDAEAERKYIKEINYEDENGDEYESYDGVPLKQIVTHLPKHVKKLRKNHLETHWEADVPYNRRSSVDWNLSGYVEIPDRDRIDIDDVESLEAEDVETIEPRVFIGDIETMPPEDGNFNRYVDDAPEPVLMITIYDTYEDVYHTIALDSEESIQGEQVRKNMADHWYGHEEYNKYTNQCEIELYRCRSESDVLNTFVDLVSDKNPDLISGWNWVQFDHMYLINRMRKFENVNHQRLSDVGKVGGRSMEKQIDGVPAFDMMQAYCDQMTFGEWRSQSLDYVAKEKLDVGKVEDISIGKNYQSNRSKLLAYNIIDVQLCVGLDDMNGIHEFFYLLSDMSGVQIYDTFSAMRLVDGYIMSRRGPDEILPSVEDKELDDNAGGLVLKPSDGISEWVGVVDLKSLYPSAFISANVSTETMTKDESEADVIVPWMPEKEDDVEGGTITSDNIVWDIDKGMGLTLDKEGIIPKYLSLIFADRAAMKDERNEYEPGSEEYEVWDNRQNAVKVVMNSFYGVSSNDYWRLSAPELGDTITAAARYVTWKGVQIAEDMGYDVRYGDTDSIMIELADPDKEISPNEVVDRGFDIEEEVNNALDRVADDLGIPETGHPHLKQKDLHGTDRHCFVFEFEKLYRRFFQHGKKKRYAGLIYWKEGKWLVDPEDAKPEDAKLDVTGYEAKRSSVPEITEKVQKKVMSKILNGQTFEHVSEYVENITNDIDNLNIELRKIGKPGAINKPLHEYPNREVPRACEYMNKHLGYNWDEGDDPWIYYVESTPPMEPNTDVMALEWNEETPDGYHINTNKHIEKYISNPLKPIIEEVGWTMNELKTGKRSQSIELGGSGDFGDVSLGDSKGISSGVDTADPFGNKEQENDGDEEGIAVNESGNPFTGNDSNEEDESKDSAGGALDW